MSGRLRVVHLITKLELGGAQLATLHAVGQLDRSRFEAGLICGPGGLLDDEARRLTDVDVRFVPSLVREVHPLRDLRAVLDLARTLREMRPDVAHTNSSKAGILGRWAAALARVPVVVHTIHGFGIAASDRPWIRRAFVAAERWTAPLTTHFVAVSQANVRTGQALSLLSPDQASVIRAGVQLGEFHPRPEARAEVAADLGVPTDGPWVGMVGCLKPQKAPQDFVRVAAQVARRHPQARFLLVGDGELRPEVEALVAELGVERFHLLGWRRDVPRVLAALDVFVLTSRWEGLPCVLPEAKSTGLPVIATAVDGSPEVIEPGVDGFLRESGDVEGIAEDVVTLLDDPERRALMARRGRESVGEWDADVMVRQLEELYVRLVERHRPRRLATSESGC